MYVPGGQSGSGPRVGCNKVSLVWFLLQPVTVTRGRKAHLASPESLADHVVKDERVEFPWWRSG